MNSVPKLFSCSYADCWTENHFSTEFGVLTSNRTHSHTIFWGCVSRWFGRALAWHARGHRFDPGNLHQKEKHCTGMCSVFCCICPAMQPLNSCWTFAESYGIILSAIAGIVHRLVYQPSKLRRWVRFPLPAPKDLNLERFGSFLFVRAVILPTGGGNATIEP